MSPQCPRPSMGRTEEGLAAEKKALLEKAKARHFEEVEEAINSLYGELEEALDMEAMQNGVEWSITERMLRLDKIMVEVARDIRQWIIKRIYDPSIECPAEEWATRLNGP